MKQAKIYFLGLTALSAAVSSCTSQGDNPGIEYAPDMYVSKGYEPFSQVSKTTINPNGMTMRLPVAGSVARGQMAYIYPYANTAEGYEASSAYMAMVPPTKANVDEGAVLYNTYCWNCHGKKGGNDGPVIASGKYPPPPWANYQSEYVQNLPVGKIYHTITYGKGLMGSHASVLSPEDRWKVIHYVKSLSLGDKFQYAADAATNAGSNGTSSMSADMKGGKYMGYELAELSEADKSSLNTAFQNVNFKMLTSKIKDESFTHLDKVVAYLKKNNNKAVVTGFAVGVGADKIEKGLSESRAQAVKDYLVSKGIDAARIIVKGMGGDEQVSSNNTSEGRQQNRRVEINIIK